MSYRVVVEQSVKKTVQLDVGGNEPTNGDRPQKHSKYSGVRKKSTTVLGSVGIIE